MINSSFAEPLLRVAILSDSAIQRAKLKQLLKTQGSQIVHEDTLGAYHPNDLANPTDVLLVDLKNASDMSLQKLDELIDDNRVPVLFNDGETIPSEDGPVRDDWVNNLTNKLFTLANRPIYKAPKKKNQKLQKNKFNEFKLNTILEPILKKDFPRTTIISKSKTRRNILQNVLIQQGLTTVHIRSFDDADVKEMQKICDILLLDQHNIGGEDIAAYEMLKIQKKLGYIICDSSKLPIRSKDRLALGIKLIKKLTSKASRCCINTPDTTPNALFEGEHYIPNKSATDHSSSNAVNSGIKNNVSSIDIKANTQTITSKMEPIDIPRSPLFKQDPAHWADRLSDALAGVRRNLRSIERNKINLKEIKNTKVENDKTKSKADNKYINNNYVNNKDNIIPLTSVANKTTTIKKPVGANNHSIKKKKASFFIEPIIKKVVQPAPLKNSISPKVKHNPKNKEIETNSNSGILDIYSDMVEAVKQVPPESNAKISMFMDTTAKNTLQLAKKTSAQGEKVPSKKKSAQKKKINNSASADLEFSQELLTNNNQFDGGGLEFDIELSSLEENLEIFENGKDAISMFMDVDTVKKEKTGKIFGIDWSNPFK